MVQLRPLHCSAPNHVRQRDEGSVRERVWRDAGTGRMPPPPRPSRRAPAPRPHPLHHKNLESILVLLLKHKFITHQRWTAYRHPRRRGCSAPAVARARGVALRRGCAGRAQTWCGRGGPRSAVRPPSQRPPMQRRGCGGEATVRGTVGGTVWRREVRSMPGQPRPRQVARVARAAGGRRARELGGGARGRGGGGSGGSVVVARAEGGGQLELVNLGARNRRSFTFGERRTKRGGVGGRGHASTSVRARNSM